MPQGHALQAPANTGFFAAMVGDTPVSAGRCASPVLTLKAAVKTSKATAARIRLLLSDGSDPNISISAGADR
jgi:hypothetical protein